MNNTDLIITRENSKILVTNQHGMTLILENEEMLNKSDDDIITYCNRIESFNSRKRRDK